MTTKIRIATRASKLAQWQANWVADRLFKLGMQTEFVLITTRGDKDQRPMGHIKATNVFTKEVQNAVLVGDADVAVHSLKDLGTAGPDELTLAAVPARGATTDVLVSRDSTPLSELPPGAVLGTGSVRRRAQLALARGDLEVRDIRGNVETRLAKLDRGNYDAIVLAKAGLERLGLADRITEPIPEEIMLPAVGQGALGLEARSDDTATQVALTPLNDPATRAAVTAERTLMAALEGGCMAPIGALGRVNPETGRLTLTARVVRADGAEKREGYEEGNPSEAEAIGEALARRLLAEGAKALVEFERHP